MASLLVLLSSWKRAIPGRPPCPEGHSTDTTEGILMTDGATTSTWKAPGAQGYLEFLPTEEAAPVSVWRSACRSHTHGIRPLSHPHYL